MRKILLIIGLAATLTSVFALSEELRQPKIFFRRGYDTNRTEKVTAVLTSKEFKYKTGLTSYWEPDFATTLVYEGDAKSLSEFVAALNRVPGMKVALTFSPDLSKEMGSALTAGSWWVKYRHTEPDTLTVRVNLAAEMLGKEKFTLEFAK
jgi:hypothetical protein